MRTYYLNIEPCMIRSEYCQQVYLEANHDPENFQKAVRSFLEELDYDDEIIIVDMGKIQSLWLKHCHENMY